MRNIINKISSLKIDKWSRWAMFCLLLIIITGLFSSVIANKRPYMIKYKGENYYPILSKKFEQKYIEEKGYVDWDKIKIESNFLPLIPFDAGESDVKHANYRPPLTINKHNTELGNTCDACLDARQTHWLGTNLKGEDLLSGLIHGTTVSLKIGLFSILIALIIGVTLGLIAGYFQNDTWKIPLLSFVIMLIAIVPMFYMASVFSFLFEIYSGWENTALLVGKSVIYISIFLISQLISYYTGKSIHSIFKWKKQVAVPIDTIVSRVIEIFAAIPKLMLIVALAVILDRSITNVIIVIGISSWAGIARLVRAETLKMRNQDFIVSAKALGLKNMKIILRHILPNISGPIMVSFVFGLSAAILIESGLSFLNMGVPENVVTWGQLLADGKKNFNAWWLIVFPGAAVFITVLCLNILGEKFKTLLDPKNRSFT